MARIRARASVIFPCFASSEARRERSVHSFGLNMFEELEGLQASSERRVAGSDMAYFNDGSVEGLRVFVSQAYERASSLLAAAGLKEGVR